MPRAAPRQHDVVAFLRLGIQARDFLGAILQVTIHHHHPVTMAVIKPGSDAVVLAEIAAELDAMHARVGDSQPLDQLPRVVAPAIFDQHDFKIRRDTFQCRLQPEVQLIEAMFGLIYRNDDGDGRGGMHHLAACLHINLLEIQYFSI